MKPALKNYSNPDTHESGAALLIVLALVVLLTAFAVAFFTRAASDRQVSSGSSNQSKADLLALGAVATTVGDIKQELVAGSTTSMVAGVTLYVPKTSASPATIVPSLVGSSGSGGVENLVKRSTSGSPFYPANANFDTGNYPAPNRAVPLASTVASLNNRSVSSARWNKPLLIAKQNPASDTDITPVSAAFTAPDWIIVARNGTNPPSWNTNLVTSPSNPTSAVGRYAYAIYDEGGLLDMNVGGYPSPMPTPYVGRKGQSAFADLTLIPGIAPVAAITPSLTPTKQAKFISNLVGWRNYVTANASGSFGNFSSSNAFTFSSGAPFYNAVLSNTNGFLTISNTTLSGSQSDRLFTSRQQLISLLTRGIASGGNSATSIAERASMQYALQSLGTFSRELNRPSWSPSTPVGSTINYAGLAETSGSINRDLATVRVPFPTPNPTPTPRPDGSPFVAGEPLLKRRFPLSRLSGLGPSGPVTTSNSTLLNGIPAPASTPTVQRDFGLQWDSSTNRWKYVGASGSTVQSTIETLDQVAAEFREPNFFEVLKAVILSGSVGLGSGSASPQLAPTPTPTFVASEKKYYYTTNNFSADHQILQIGANIIDAWDLGNIPTFIGFRDPTTSSIYEIAGVANLPYLSKLVYAPIMTNHGSADEFSAWLEPSFWNPHQNAGAATGTVRFAMISGSMQAVLSDGKKTTYTSPAVTSASFSPYPYIEVQANAFQVPSAPVPANESASNVPSPKTSDSAIFINDGILFCYRVLATTTGITRKTADNTYPLFGAGTSFAMQVKVNGSWKNYQTWVNGSNWKPLTCNSVPNAHGGWQSLDGYLDPEFVLLDPRTVRFGAWGNDAADTPGKKNGNTLLDFTSGPEVTMDENNGNAVPESIFAYPPQGSFFVTSVANPNVNSYLYSTNLTSGTDYYRDLDSVVRKGDWTTDSAGTANGKTIMYAAPTASPSPTPNNSQDRPRMSGPFQSVAELGAVFRDQPWKTLNFSTTNSGDAGLLDAFTLQELPLAAGRVSINTRQSGVLAAIISQAIQNQAAGAVVGKTGTSLITINPADVTTIAGRITAITATSPPNPLLNKAELVTKVMEDATLTANVWSKATTDPWNKESREAVVRALSDATQTRTWNLMIDVIAQSGKYPPNATSLANFVVEGEKRYWLHIAIDRFTGEVIDQQLEAVYE